jgi:hypothetical protein
MDVDARLTRVTLFIPARATTLVVFLDHPIPEVAVC